MALSAFHREMLGVSKIDKVSLQIANITDANPLSEIEVKIEHKLRGTGEEIQVDEKGALKIEEDLISDEIYKIFKSNVINYGQKFAFPIWNEKCILICYVEKITPINVKSRLPYGVLESLEASDIICSAKNKQ